MRLSGKDDVTHAMKTTNVSKLGRIPVPFGSIL